MPRIERPAMASYGVPADVDGALPWSWAEERLVRSRNYWIVTVDPRGRPHAMPAWGVWRPEEERFWFSSAPDALKARNIAENPNVVVAADDSVEVVSVEGAASREPASREVAEAYGAKYEAAPAKQAELAGFFLAHATFAVAPVKAFGVIERPDEFASRATRWVWER